MGGLEALPLDQFELVDWSVGSSCDYSPSYKPSLEERHSNYYAKYLDRFERG